MRRRRHLLVGILAIVGVCGALWIWRGPQIVFRVQLWLLVHGMWGNLDSWIAHANLYLPFLIEEAGNTTPIKTRMVRLTNRTDDAFELYRYIEVSTVSDCARIVLHATVSSVGDDFGYSYQDSVTDERRKQAGLKWEAWYRKYKNRLRWDIERKIFVIREEN